MLLLRTTWPQVFMKLLWIPLRSNLLFWENASHMVPICGMSARCHDSIGWSQQQLPVTVHHSRTPLCWGCLDLLIQAFCTPLLRDKALSLRRARKSIAAIRTSSLFMFSHGLVLEFSMPCQTMHSEVEHPDIF